MISVKEAKSLILDHISPLPVQQVTLAIAAGATLGADVYAQYDIPAFVQSSMDGYAFRFADRNQPLIVHGEMQAGTSVQSTLLPQYASRVFTGAPIPNGADTVVMQEKVEILNDKIIIQDLNLSLGDNVRDKGAEVTTGALAMARGSKLTPAAIGFLAGIGVTDVKVHQIPTVGVIATGKELQQPGNPLSFGQVYESNSFSLAAALEQAQISKINFYAADDNLEELTAVLKDALKDNDVVLLTGGVSVGDYDFVIRAADRAGVSQIFHKVKQKPGKPLYFGKTDAQLVFGLPGNPSSVLSCFYHYVLPALEKLSNYKTGITDNDQPSGRLKSKEALLMASCTKPAGITHFLKAWYNDGNVTPLHAQESFRMSSFAAANCMIELGEEQTSAVAGTMVKVHIFPE